MNDERPRNTFFGADTIPHNPLQPGHAGSDPLPFAAGLCPETSLTSPSTHVPHYYYYYFFFGNDFPRTPFVVGPCLLYAVVVHASFYRDARVLLPGRGLELV